MWLCCVHTFLLLWSMPLLDLNLDIVLRWFIGLETDVCGLLGLGVFGGSEGV